MSRRLFAALALVFIVAGCETSTPYAPAGASGYGFSDQRIERNRYRITFRGNSLTDKDTVETYLLFRAAELAVQSGYDYFTLVESDTEKQSTFTATSTAFGAGRGFFPGYYAYGWGWAQPIDTTIRERRKYSATAYVLFGEGEKPAGDRYAYDAREVMRNLRGALVLPQS